MRLLKIEIELFDKKEKEQEEALGIAGLCQNKKTPCVIDLDQVESFWFEPAIDGHAAGILITFKSSNTLFTDTYTVDEMAMLVSGDTDWEDYLTNEVVTEIKKLRR